MIVPLWVIDSVFLCFLITSLLFCQVFPLFLAVAGFHCLVVRSAFLGFPFLLLHRCIHHAAMEVWRDPSFTFPTFPACGCLLTLSANPIAILSQKLDF